MWLLACSGWPAFYKVLQRGRLQSSLMMMMMMIMMTSELTFFPLRALAGNASDPKAKFVGSFAKLFADTAYNLIAETAELNRQSTAAEINWGLFPISDRAKKLHWELLSFMDQHVYPA